MFSIFTSKVSVPDKLDIRPLSPRKPCIYVQRKQQQSPFFSKLPAEIRNDIYKYVFAAGAREILSLEAHPLSLLLTCQQLYNEASVLAFVRYIFPLSPNPAFQAYSSMRNAVLHLSSQHIQAITAISHVLQTVGFGEQAAKVMANAIRLFPNLNYFQIRILRTRLPVNNIHNIAYTSELDEHEYAIGNFVSQWLQHSLLGSAMGGYAWQEGERWKVKWPQLDDENYFRTSEGVNPDGEKRYVPFMSSEVVGHVRGVQMCFCGCGNIEWTIADLVQQTGRKVAVDTVYYGPESRPLPDLDANTMLRLKKGPKAVILKENVPRLNLLERSSHSASMRVQGYAYDPDRNYWITQGWRNGDWKALYRGVRNSLDLTSGTSEDRLLGSKDLKEGDWARSEMPTS
jgi:hypothetical protein